MNTLGARLSAVRERRGLTQGEVAQRAHVPQQAISRLERGDRTHVRSDVLARLAIALDVSADVLLGLRDLADDAATTPPAPPQPTKRPRARKAAPVS
jgi:transcriptional regulator with XRE-family HTH domain